jgi:predicted  nucleic acid-binding Zn-ribbon protein
MNSYSENLHSNVLASLESQEMNQKKLESQLNSSMFALYYAEGAEIVTNEKLHSVTKKYKQVRDVKEQAVKNKNISSNILMSAIQQNTYTAQSVTNLAVSASNIQIATNAIVRLASDMGSIFSIINAADYGTQIYQQSIEAYSLMNKTAYLAEVASQHAMEASSSIAEVTSSSVEDKAKLTDASIDNLLKVINSDFTAIATIVSTENDAKAAASVNTKAAEGIIEYNKVEFEAAKVAYKINNKSLNFNLRVNVPKLSDDFYDVAFDYYKSPFNSDDYKSPFAFDEKGKNPPSLGLENPVKSYNLFLVKESKKSIFSTSTAEDLLSSPLRHIKIDPPTHTASDTDISKTNATITTDYTNYFDALSTARLSKANAIEARENVNKTNAIVESLTKEKSNTEATLQNIKNDITKLTKDLEQAKNRVAEATEAAKKDPKSEKHAKDLAEAIKNHKKLELSLESAKLNEIKTTDSIKVAADNLKIAITNGANARTEATNAEEKAATDEEVVKKAAEKSVNSKKQGFRTIKILDLFDTDGEMIVLGEKYVIFLLTVFTEEFKKGINTYDDYLSAPSETFSIKKTLDAIKDVTIAQVSKKVDFNNPELPTISPYAINFTANKSDDKKNTEYRCIFLPYNDNFFTNKELDDLEESIEVSIIKKEMQSLKTNINHFTEDLDSLEKKIKGLKEELKNKNDSKGDAETIKVEKAIIKNNIDNYESVKEEVDSKQTIAKDKLAQLKMALEKALSNIPTPIKNKKAFFFNLKLAENVPFGNYTVAELSTENSSDKDIVSYEVKINFSTSDNFGNLLTDSKPYIPVILSYYNGPETNKNHYNNNLSDWENEEPFIFSASNNQ